MSIALSASQALQLWHDTSIRLVRSDTPDLTLRQMSILLHIYMVPPPHTVRGLAAQLGVTKPVITRALDTMGELGFVSRVRDDRDRRNVIIQRTVGGALYLEALGDIIVERAAEITL